MAENLSERVARRYQQIKTSGPKIDTKGYGDWTVYWETSSPKTIHRWKYRSKQEAANVAKAKSKETGAFVGVDKGGVEQMVFHKGSPA